MTKKKTNSNSDQLTLPTINDDISNETRPLNLMKNELANTSQEAFSKSRFLANSIGFYSFLNKSKNKEEKILPFIYLSLITASELRIYNSTLEEFYNSYCKKVSLHFEGNTQDSENWGIAFFLFLIGEKPQEFGIKDNLMNIFSHIGKAVELIIEVRNGKRSTKAMLEFIRYFSDEPNDIPGLKEFIQVNNEDDPFLNLPTIKNDLFKILEKQPTIDSLKYRLQIIKALAFVLENSTKDPKDIVIDFLSNIDEETTELDIYLFALFLIRLFYGNPYEKTIPLSFLDNNSMNYIAPLSEVFINPKPIIEGAKNSKLEIEEYFWIYVRNNPKSIFEDIQSDEIEIIKTIKVKRKNFGEIISFDY